MSLFHKQAFKNMKTVGAIAPSSVHLAQRMVSSIDFNKENVTVLEYGPGTGSVTKTLLSHLNQTGRLIAIEMNQRLASHLLEEFPDPRLHVVVGNASDAQAEIAKLPRSGVKVDRALFDWISGEEGV